MSQLKTVKLYGALTEFSGNEPLEMVTNDNRDTFSMLKTWFPNFKRFMNENPTFIVVLSDKDKANPRPIPAEFVLSPYGECEEIHIFPAAEGAGAEVALWALGTSTGFLASAVTFAVNMAISMALGAVVQALSPKPQASASENPANEPSFLFNGPENVSEQGYQLPIVYGTHMTGSIVLSAGIAIEQTGTVNPTGNPTATYPPSVAWQFNGKRDDTNALESLA